MVSLQSSLMLFVVFVDYDIGLTKVSSQTCLSSPSELEWIEEFNDTYYGVLSFEACVIESGGDKNIPYGWTTRCHNGSIPSPTLTMKRDSVYYLTLINNLGAESPDNGQQTNNEQKDANTTNIHTHGLHISGEWPSDDIFTHVLPGESIQYKFELPCDHSGGMAWYHPHHHGSTALQVLGGAAGLIRVDEDKIEEGLPDWYINMDEILLIIQYVELTELDGYFPSNLDYLTKVDNGANDFYLVNGEYVPTICMTAGQWKKVKL